MAIDADQRHADRIVGADGIRAIAALGLVFSHLYQRLNPPMQQNWYQQAQLVFMKGAFGVSVFFALAIVLKGLLAANLTLSDEGKAWELGDIGSRLLGRIVDNRFARHTATVSYGRATLGWRWIERPALRSGWANRR